MIAVSDVKLRYFWFEIPTQELRIALSSDSRTAGSWFEFPTLELPTQSQSQSMAIFRVKVNTESETSEPNIKIKGNRNWKY